ncbi:MAG: hypothetical protein U9O54_05875 [Chloroflexota bacterium]|nr:hypothetical protein [Chloroflexota bacterium]
MAHKKLLLILILFIFILLIASCRATPKAFKGMELYSWQNDGGDWMFSIMPGTNRLKTVSEVKGNSLSLRGVKTKFCQMAKAEQVFWMASAQNPAMGEAQAFPYPPEVIATEIETFANTCGVELVSLYP